MEYKQKLQETVNEILRNQEKQLRGQQEALELQREQYAMAKTQFERVEKLQQRAERLRVNGAWMMGTARKVLAVILPIVIALVICLSWLILR